jgi:hypothetical protein
VSDRRSDTTRWVCPRCGYDLSNPTGPRCPECGGASSDAISTARLRHRFRLVATFVNLWDAVLIVLFVLGLQLHSNYAGSPWVSSPVLWIAIAVYLTASVSLHLGGFYLFQWAILIASGTQVILGVFLIGISLLALSGLASVGVAAFGCLHAWFGCILAEKFLKLRRSSAGD